MLFKTKKYYIIMDILDKKTYRMIWDMSEFQPNGFFVDMPIDILILITPPIETKLKLNINILYLLKRPFNFYYKRKGITSPFIELVENKLN